MTALRSRLDWPTILIALLVALAVIFFNWLVWRAQWPLEIDGNEPWNAYQVDRLAAGLPLYPPSDALIANNYPPLSFILAHWLTRVLSFDAIIIGRCLSLLGILVTAAGCGFSTRVMGGGAAAVTLSVAWYIATMSRHFDIYAGMNDPQIFAGSIMMAGMVCFIVACRDRRSVIPAFALMVLASFFKHNLFATPATAIVWLLIHDRRAAMGAIGASIALIAAGFVASTIAFGLDFLYQLFPPREMRLLRIVQRIGHMQWIAPAGVIVVIWIVRARNNWQAQFCGLFCLCGLLSHLLQQTGEGVDTNSQFELVTAIAIGLGLALGGIGCRQVTSRVVQTTILAVVILRLLLISRFEPYLVLMSQTYRENAQRSLAIVAKETDAIRKNVGLAVCTIPTVCRQAGQPFVVDRFIMSQKVAVGLLSAAELDARIRQAGISVVAIDPDASTRLLSSEAKIGHILDHQRGLLPPHPALALPDSGHSALWRLVGGGAEAPLSLN